MTTPTFTTELIAALGKGEIISTGGGCMAISVNHRGVDYLITDADAGLPDGCGLWLGHDVHPDGESSCDCDGCIGGIAGIGTEDPITDPAAWATQILAAMDADETGRTERGL